MADIADGQLCIILPVLGQQRDCVPKPLQEQAAGALALRSAQVHSAPKSQGVASYPARLIQLAIRQASIALLQLWLQGIVPA